MTSPLRKRQRLQGTASEYLLPEEQENPEAEVKHLRKVVVEQREEIQRMREEHERELGEQKAEKERLWDLLKSIVEKVPEPNAM